MESAHLPTVVLVRPRTESPLFEAHDHFRLLTDQLAEQFPNARFICVPFLYDATGQSLATAAIRQWTCPKLVLSSLSPRAAQWLFHEWDCDEPSRQDSFHQVELYTIESLGPVVENFLKTHPPAGEATTSPVSPVSPIYIDETLLPRWYPIIDYDACIGCLECVNFCLFGVYTIDTQSRPVVESPDACRNGCPACSRVCPGGAIMFPLHADAAISGQLDALTVARQIQEHDTARRAREIRNEHLDQIAQPKTNKATDELDQLIDEADRFQE
ncbi:MAG: ferredoxin family protein [Thermoguttaceae bacterium]|nr:ferredoxin family protein [Thermoguttaceae bacterium]